MKFTGMNSIPSVKTTRCSAILCLGNQYRLYMCDDRH